MDVGFLILRLVVGGVIAAHGAQKLFGWFGGHGLRGTGGWLESLGFKPGRFHATLTALAELGGGLLLILGFLTPLGGTALIGVMLVAIATVHWEGGFFNTAGGYEFNLVLVASGAALAFTGPGAISVDAVLDLDLSGIGWGLFALAAGALLATLVIGSRRPASPVPDDARSTASTEDHVIDLTVEEEEPSLTSG